MNPETTACFTGHRPDKLRYICGDQETIDELRHELQIRILRAVEDGYRTFLCGMAQGIDLWAGEIVLALQEVFPDLELMAVMPFPGQGSGWPAEWKQLQQRILRFSTEIIMVSPHYHRGCFQKRNRFLVDHASRLIGVWMEGCSGGTDYTIRYAQKAGVDLDIILLDQYAQSDASVSLL